MPLPAPTTPPGGLTTQEAEAVRARMGPRKPPKTSRSYAEIVWANTFTLFNLVLLVLLIPMLVLGLWSDALFGGVLIANTLIGIIQETRAKRTLDRLALLVAPHAQVMRDGAQVDLPVQQVVPGDVVLVQPGDQVVADGTLVQAAVLSLDESALTGESDAVSKHPGDDVLSGSFCVAGAGAFQVTAVGSDSFAERLAAEAKGTRVQLSPLQLDINRILTVLIWVLIPMAVLMVISSFWLSTDVVSGAQRTVAALVPLVPEGLVLLASLTFAVAAIRLGRMGTLAQQLNAIESLASVDVVCVDKTGTLTENRLDVVGVAPAPGHDEDAVRHAAGLLAASAAARNGTSDAILRAMPADAVAPTAEVPFASSRKWSGATLPGQGTVIMGAPEILQRVGVDIPAELQQRIAAEQAQRRRVLLVAMGSEPLDEEQDGMGHLPADTRAAGAILLEEALRSDAPATVAFLQREGVEVKVISGDGVGTVQAVALACGINGADDAIQGPDLPDDPEALREIVTHTAVFGRITPEQKRALVNAMTANGRYVAMIGDGVNDVLALKDARLAVAMGNGSQMAKGVADLVLLTNAFSTLPKAIEAGRQIIRNTHRVAKLFITKSVYSALLLLAFALLPIAYPFLPRQLSITSSLTIGIPAFFLALAASSGPVRRNGFMRSLWAFAIPAGIIIALAISAAYLLSRGPMDTSIEDARTAAILAATFLGLAVVIELERGVERRKVRRWVWGMVAGFVVLLTVGLHIPILRTFFEIGEPTMQQWGLIAAVVVVGIVLLLAVRRIPWLMRIEAPPAEDDDLVAIEQRG